MSSTTITSADDRTALDLGRLMLNCNRRAEAVELLEARVRELEEENEELKTRLSDNGVPDHA